MCIQIIDLDTRQEIDTVGQLKKILNIKKLPTLNVEDEDLVNKRDKSCLCNIDVKYACESNGFSFEENERDIWQAFIKKNEN